MDELRRLVWRYQAGLLRREQVQERLRNEIATLVTQYRLEEPQWSRVAQPGRREFAVRVKFDQAIGLAGTQMREGCVRESCASVQNARSALKELIQATQASAHVQQAREGLSELPSQAAPDFANCNSTVSAAIRLTECAQERLDRGEYAAAQYLARLCTRLLNQTSLGEPPESAISEISEISEIKERIAKARQREFAAEDRSVVSPSESVRKAGLAAAEHSGERQQWGLACAVLEDLAIIDERALTRLHLRRAAAAVETCAADLKQPATGDEPS